MLKNSDWSSRMKVSLWGLLALAVWCPPAKAEQLISDDLRLKSASPELYFEDTSPAYQWKIYPDSASFDIVNVTLNQRPFSIRAAAPANSFYMVSDGSIGLGTASPVANIHGVSGTGSWSQLMVPASNNSTRKFRMLVGNLLGKDGFHINEDTFSGDAPFFIHGLADDNSLHIDSEYKIGLGNPSPIANLDCINHNDDWTMRMESNNSSEQIWGFLAGSSNFYLQNITGNKNPVVVTGTAPTNSLVVGLRGLAVGTDGPDFIGNVSTPGKFLNLKASGAGLDGLARMVAQGPTGAQFHLVHNNGPTNQRVMRMQNVNGITSIGFVKDDLASNLVSNAFVIKNLNGNIGLKQANPLHPLHLVSGAHVTAGGVWTNASSRELKQDIAPITSEQAREAVRSLQPVGYRYKEELDEQYVGFIAEDVPELVATKDRKSLAPMDITAVLTKVVQDQDRELATEREKNATQQKLIADLSERLLKLEQKLGE